MLTRAQLCPDEIPAAGEVVAVLVSEEQGLAPSLQLNCWLIRWRQIPAALIFGVLGAYLWAVLASIFSRPLRKLWKKLKSPSN
jgi:hypothetical protein